jgi:hypothetical protein
MERATTNGKMNSKRTVDDVSDLEERKSAWQRRRLCATIPNDVERYIVVGYTEEMAGKDIPPEWTVKAANGRYFTDDETRKFKEKSTTSSPTYGLCHMCYGSGPVSMLCQNCKRIDRRYAVARDRRIWKILDAEWVSRFFQTTHLIAKADSTHVGERTPINNIGGLEWEIFISKRWTGDPTNPRRSIEVAGEFLEGLRAEESGEWDVLSNTATLLDNDPGKIWTGTYEEE